MSKNEDIQWCIDRLNESPLYTKNLHSTPTFEREVLVKTNVVKRTVELLEKMKAKPITPQETKDKVRKDSKLKILAALVIVCFFV